MMGVLKYTYNFKSVYSRRDEFSESSLVNVIAFPRMVSPFSRACAKAKRLGNPYRCFRLRVPKPEIMSVCKRVVRFY